MKGLTDSHTHTTFSPDSSMTIKQAIETAKAIGLSGIAFTDHLDLKAPGEDDRFFFSPNEQHREVELHQNGNSINLLKGIEIGLQPDNLLETKEYLSGCEFDIVIASVHFVDGIDPYKGDYYKGLNYKEAYGRYLEQISLLTQSYGDFDILGHYDYIARYAPYEVRSIFYRDYSDILDTILIYLAHNGKAIEINTNTYRYRNGSTPVPDINIIKRFRELGGEYISIGSDAHSSDRVGEMFEFASDLLKRGGFKYVTHFKNREAKPIKI